MRCRNRPDALRSPLLHRGRTTRLPVPEQLAVIVVDLSPPTSCQHRRTHMPAYAPLDLLPRPPHLYRVLIHLPGLPHPSTPSSSRHIRVPPPAILVLRCCAPSPLPRTRTRLCAAAPLVRSCAILEFVRSASVCSTRISRPSPSRALLHRLRSPARAPAPSPIVAALQACLFIQATYSRTPPQPATCLAVVLGCPWHLPHTAPPRPALHRARVPHDRICSPPCLCAAPEYTCHSSDD